MASLSAHEGQTRCFSHFLASEQGWQTLGQGLPLVHRGELRRQHVMATLALPMCRVVVPRPALSAQRSYAAAFLRLKRHTGQHLLAPTAVPRPCVLVHIDGVLTVCDVPDKTVFDQNIDHLIHELKLHKKMRLLRMIYTRVSVRSTEQPQGVDSYLTVGAFVLVCLLHACGLPGD